VPIGTPGCAGGGYTIGQPKSASSRRTVVLDAHTVDLLAKAIVGKSVDDLVFPNPATGEHWRGSVFTRSWNRARDAAAAAGLAKRPRFHDLRHTHAAWLLTDGVPLLVVSRRLGHDSVAITASTYGLLHPDADDAVLASPARHQVSR
jgi:integrase